MDDEYRKLVRRARLAQLIKEAAESLIHKDLVEKLRQFAEGRAFGQMVRALPSGKRPDCLALKTTKDGPAKVFIGDAKVAENERPSHEASFDRINNYIEEFASLLADESIDGGIIAIATDREDAAREWAGALEKMCHDAGIVDFAKNGPSFRVVEFDAYWIAYW